MFILNKFIYVNSFTFIDFFLKKSLIRHVKRIIGLGFRIKLIQLVFKKLDSHFYRKIGAPMEHDHLNNKRKKIKF